MLGGIYIKAFVRPFSERISRLPFPASFSAISPTMNFSNDFFIAVKHFLFCVSLGLSRGF